MQTFDQLLLMMMLLLLLLWCHLQGGWKEDLKHGLGRKVYAKHPTTAAAAAVSPFAGWLEGGPEARSRAQGVRQTPNDAAAASSAAAVPLYAGWLEGGSKARPGAQGVRQTPNDCCCCCCCSAICRVAGRRT
jgi:hypothetical protein